jgi:hypothetical protein
VVAGAEVVVVASVVAGAVVVVGASVLGGATVVAGWVVGVVLAGVLCVPLDPPVVRSTMIMITAMTTTAPTATAIHTPRPRFCGR